MLQSIDSPDLGSFYGLLPPLALLLFCEPQGIRSREQLLQTNETAILSCTSTPPRRVDLKRAVYLSASYVDRSPLSKNTSLKAFWPYSICGKCSPSIKHEPLRTRVWQDLPSLPEVTL